jgi:hypothetical protein
MLNLKVVVVPVQTMKAYTGSTGLPAASYILKLGTGFVANRQFHAPVALWPGK